MAPFRAFVAIVVALALLITAFVLVLTLIVPWPVAAHEPYSGWTAPDNPGLSCCDGNDCRPTRAYLGEDGLWRAWNGYLWLTIPPGRVLPTDFARDGRNHLCEREGVVYCFTPGQPRS